LLNEHSGNRFTAPALRGHRLVARPEGAGPIAGSDWSTDFSLTGLNHHGEKLTIETADDEAGLELRTEYESLPGGAIRARHRLTNTAPDPYLLEGLEVVFPVADHLTEVLDFTGRQEAERTPQRHQLGDGRWSRENRRGKTGADAATLLVAGTPAFSFTHGEMLALHVAWSGNSVMRIERDASSRTFFGGGELLLPGEIVLESDESYTTPWVYVVASGDGLDSVAAAFHRWLRSLPAHPAVAPVTLNVWEAVYFDHDVARLHQLAHLAGRVGVERFVLDDGWFHRRRHDRAGLGDWWVDTTVWPQGLGPFIDLVHSLGMQFGLWFEPEMVNPDSELYAAHPDWILAAGNRVPVLRRNQLVLDLTRREVWSYLLGKVDSVLSEYDIDYVKWDHNRDLLEAGSWRRRGGAAVHDQTVAFYALLDELRGRHPAIAWESCASGGGRIDLEVLERVQRVWTSDMTDALARQSIQRWTTQLVAPEYLGAHVSAPISAQTGRTMSLDFRAATAFFGAFGIEWDLTTASEEDLERLTEWVVLHKQFRNLLHTGRVVRPDSSDTAVLMHGVVAVDGQEALLAHVQLDESTHSRGVTLRIPGLDVTRRFDLSWLLTPAARADTDPEATRWTREQRGPSGGAPIPGAILAAVGLFMPRRRAQTVTLVHARATAS
jgi:alpha-galactosidase